MRKPLTHPVTLIVVFLLVVGFILLERAYTGSTSHTTSTSAASRANSAAIQASLVAAILQDVIDAHAQLVVVNGSLSYGATNTVPAYLAASQHLLSTDLIAYLENASDKKSALGSLKTQVHEYESQGSQYALSLESIVQEQTTQYQQCTQAKQNADAMFYQGLREGSASTMQQGLDQAQEKGSCQAKARVLTTANTVLLQRVQKIQTMLSSVYTVLDTNETTIVQNFPLFKDSNLERLVSLRNSLRQMSLVSAQ